MQHWADYHDKLKAGYRYTVGLTVCPDDTGDARADHWSMTSLKEKPIKIVVTAMGAMSRSKWPRSPSLPARGAQEQSGSATMRIALRADRSSAP